MKRNYQTEVNVLFGKILNEIVNDILVLLQAKAIPNLKTF